MRPLLRSGGQDRSTVRERGPARGGATAPSGPSAMPTSSSDEQPIRLSIEVSTVFFLYRFRGVCTANLRQSARPARRRGGDRGACGLGAREGGRPTLTVLLAVAATARSILSMASKDRMAALRIPPAPKRWIGFLLVGRHARLLLVAIGAADRPAGGRARGRSRSRPRLASPFDCCLLGPPFGRGPERR